MAGGNAGTEEAAVKLRCGTPGIGFLRRKARKAGRRCAFVTYMRTTRGEPAPRSLLIHQLGLLKLRGQSACFNCHPGRASAHLRAIARAGIQGDLLRTSQSWLWVPDRGVMREACLQHDAASGMTVCLCAAKGGKRSADST